MRINLPKPTVVWLKDSFGEWSLQTRRENTIEVALLKRGDGEWEWITFWPTTCPSGATEIASGWTRSVREGKLRVKESLLKAGVLK